MRADDQVFGRSAAADGESFAMSALIAASIARLDDRLLGRSGAADSEASR